MGEESLKKIGEYHVVRKLGEGAMGQVFEAYRSGDDETRYAIKVLPPEVSQDKEKVARFKREVSAVEKLDHENVVKAHAFGRHGGNYYFVMDYIDGESMDRIIFRQGISVVNSAKYTLQAAQALDHAHKKGVVHRDIKPSNLMVDRSGHVFLTDFGIAREEGALGLTAQGQIMGTPNYMPPEQALGRGDDVDGRSDLYSLGASFYDMLTRAVPFSAENPQAVLKKVVEEDPIPPSRINGRVPRALELVVLKALRKSKAKRYQTGKEFADDLSRWLDGKPVRAKAETPVEKALKFVTRHRSFTLMAAVFLVFAIGFVVFLKVSAAQAEADKLSLEKERQDQVTQHVKTAQEHLKAGRFDKARKAFRQALDVDENSVDAALGLDRVEDRQKEQKDAKVRQANRKKADRIAKAAMGFVERGDAVFLERVELYGKIRHLLSAPLPTDEAEKEKKMGLPPRRGNNYEGTELNRLRLAIKKAEARENTEYNGGLEEFGKALLIDPECEMAHQGIAKIYMNLCRLNMYLAEETDDYQPVQRTIIMVEQHDKKGVHRKEIEEVRRRLAWTQLISFAVTPRKAKIQLISSDLEAGTYSEPRIVDQTDLTLPAGSYIFHIEAEDCVPARYHVYLRRPPPGQNMAMPVVNVELYPAEDKLDGMIYVPEGSFIFGGKEGVRGGERRSGSWKGFFIDRTEVTNRQYMKFYAAVKGGADLSAKVPSDGPKELKQADFWKNLPRPAFYDRNKFNAPDQPVVGVNWFEAYAYALWAGKRLPSRYEWEKAARGVDGRIYPWGRRFDETRCVHVRNRSFQDLSPVGSVPEGLSPFGAFDMAGNVAEWVLERFYTTEYHYTLGGSFQSPPDLLRAPSLDMMNRNSRLETIGFRCVTDP